MKLHWATYRHEYMWGSIKDWDWLPMIRYERFPLPFYPREICFDWLKWGFAIRWWWRE